MGLHMQALQHKEMEQRDRGKKKEGYEVDRHRGAARDRERNRHVNNRARPRGWWGWVQRGDSNNFFCHVNP